MDRSFDVVIVGLGAMGSATAYHLARRNLRVLGLDRFTPPHTFGSSHGQTRIIREAYYEHPLYVPLVQRAYACWTELEQELGQPLFLQTGGLMIGPPESTLVRGAHDSARLHHLSYEVLSAAEIHRRFPALCPDEEMIAVWESRAGILSPEQCVEAHLELAKRHGALLQFGETVTSWEGQGTGVRVVTSQGQYQADRLILSAGPWITRLVPELRLPLWGERQVVLWFEPAAHPEYFSPQYCPITLWEYAPERIVYNFPDLGQGIKAGLHHEGEAATPESIRRTIAPEEIELVRTQMARFIPWANGALRASTACLYTNTPDWHFLLDFHPACAQVLLVSPCSGHGFKFASVIGEIVADLLTKGCSAFDLTPFRVERLEPYSESFPIP